MTNVFKKIKARGKPSKAAKRNKGKLNEEGFGFKYSIDSPKIGVVPSKRVVVRGWIIPNKGAKVVALRAINSSKHFDIEYGVERLDVAKAFPSLDSDRTTNCGFLGSFEFKNGLLTLEVDTGKGFERIYEIDLTYSSEKLFYSYYNPKLSDNLAEHQNLLENKKKYYFEEELPGTFKRDENDPKLVAFYLPQFHPIAENDKAWGKGFTEWTNVTSAQPRFVGHQQPILPSSLGFYDLRLESNIKAQVDLAKKHGLYGFCFYYYWFSGHKLMEAPLNTFLKNQEWDFNFMICWANENWTKRWDGRDKDVIVAQKYLESDPLNFIKDVEHILLDKRYIRNNKKPVLAVYRGSELGEPKRYIKIWRDYFKKEHGQDLEILSMLNYDRADPRTNGFDAGIEFAPLTTYKGREFDINKSRMANIKDNLIDLDFDGQIVDYRAFSHIGKTKSFNFPTYDSLSPSWDNESRKKGRGSLALYGSNPDLYAHWLDKTLGRSGDKLVFINAWNEWAEGTTLEPTMHFGHALLNRTTEVMSKHSNNKENIKNFPEFGVRKKKSTYIAVVVHIYYENQWPAIEEKMKNLKDINYDLFVTVTEKNQELIKKIKNDYKNSHVYLVPNRGRDVLPFLFLLNRLDKLDYKYVLKLHTKKSEHRTDGMLWFEDLLNNLLPSQPQVKDILQRLENGAAIVGPSEHYISLEKFIFSTKKDLEKYIGNLYGEKKAGETMSNKSKYGFFAGTMFWAQISSLKPLINMNLIPEDFESEKGQIDGTLAHAIERLMTLIPLMESKDIYGVSNKGIKKISSSDIIEDYKYADN